MVKIVAQLLPFLPPGEHYHVIFMERNLAEVIASQNAMLARQGRQGAELDGRQLLETYTAQIQRVRTALARRPEMRILPVNYAELLADPMAGVDRVALFVGEPFNREAAAGAVRPQLQRQKAFSVAPPRSLHSRTTACRRCLNWAISFSCAAFTSTSVKVRSGFR